MFDYLNVASSQWQTNGKDFNILKNKASCDVAKSQELDAAG